MDKNKCFFCGKPLVTISYQSSPIHHFKQKSLGGSPNDPDNLVPSCLHCHTYVIHHKLNMTGYDLYWAFYRIMCMVNGIVPVLDGYDNDLLYWRKINSIHEIEPRYRRLALSMIGLECVMFGRSTKEFDQYQDRMEFVQKMESKLRAERNKKIQEKLNSKNGV